MKNIVKNGLLTLATAALMASCADYIDTYYPTQPDPEFKEPYKGYDPIKTYIDQTKYPNFRLGATVKVADFNAQTLAHAAVVTNFDEVAFGASMMSGGVYDASLSMFDFLPVRDLLDHVDELQYNVFGSPIAANANQADAWLNTLTAPIEIDVPFLIDKETDFSTVDKFEGTVSKGTITISTLSDGTKCVDAKNQTQFNLAEGFEVDPELTYEISFLAKATKAVSLNMTFSDNKLAVKQPITTDWMLYTIKAKPADGVTSGYFFIDPGRYTGNFYFANVKVGHFPDNHRPQTQEELRDTLTYALDVWCDGLMKVCNGRIKTFDLIDDAIDENSELINGHYDLKHSTGKNVFWQDALGSENYAPAVAKAARKAFETYEGNPAELQLFISESNLIDPVKFESLKYWMSVWDQGAKIDGISAKLNTAYYEDAAVQNEKQSAIDAMFKGLGATGKMIRLTDFDITYIDVEGNEVKADKLTDAQRDKIASYYSHIIKSYLTNIPTDKQYGICKGSLSDTSSPVGLWSVVEGDWVRTASYAAFCDALAGK